PACQQHEAFNQIDTYYSFPIVKKSSSSAAISDDFLPEFQELLTESPYMDFESWLLKLDNINAQPQIYVSEANELLRKLSLTSHSSRYKIVLMWLPERLKEDAANKLLKLVEEPYADTLFIMSSDNSRGILPTIYSRTQRIAVKRYSDEEIAGMLANKYGLEESAAAQISKLSAGNATEAVKLISLSKESDEYLQLFMELMRKAYTRDVASLKAWAADVATLGREREIKFLEYCARMVRENFILNIHRPDLNCLNSAEMTFSARFSPFINERNVLKIFKTLGDAKADIAANANAKLVNFDVAIKTILLLKQ
ncbi:MAG: hypothetical protein NC548_63805, partial [Lachnospiraceae bacterium]|nr:hypothetical protein [Lachnospiraceae bacterium]